MDPLSELDRLISVASPTERAGLVVQLSARLATLGAGLVPDPAQQPERNLDVAEAAKRLGVSERYLYRNAKRLPFARRVGRRLLFSECELSRYMAKR